MASRPNKKPRKTEPETELTSLRRGETLLREIEGSARIGHFEWDAERKCFLSCSETFAEFFDVTVEAVLEPATGWASIFSKVHPEDCEQYQALYDELSEIGEMDIDFRIINDEGDIRSFRQTGIAPSTVLQNDSYRIGIVQDITAQQVSASDFEFGESLALQAEEISDIGTFIYDEIEDRYLYASPGCARIYGISEAEYLDSVNSVDEDLADIYMLDRERVHEAYRQYFNTGKDCKIEFRALRTDGEVRWIRELLVAMQMQNGQVALSRGVLQDVTEQKAIELELRAAKQNLESLVAERTEQLANTVSRLEEEIEERKKVSAELEFLANHDPLTGLPSLRLCKDRLERALAEARRNQLKVAVLFLDLDGFKAVNDNYGHEYGDAILKMTANRIKAEVREVDTVARIGGDEFLIILSGIPDMLVVERIASSLILQVSQPISIDNYEVTVGVSVGVALYPDDATDSEELIRVADKAMYRIKNSGKNNFGFVQPERLN